ncbi:MAG: NAD-dependent epimerase/dehydratase family protein [Promethearchaeota archaeon]
MKLALVDGALGHTGSFLIKHLLETGWKIVATDLKKEDRDIIMTKEKVFCFDLKYLDCREWESVTYIPSDLTKKDTLKNLFDDNLFLEGKKNYDVIFHPASLYDYGAPYDLLHLVNYEGLKNLLDVMFEHCKKTNTEPPRFIHWSTCGVYGEPRYKKNKKGFIYPIDETAPFNPPNNYSQTKTEQDKLIFKTAEENPNFKYTIIRPAPIFGPYQTYGMYHLYYLSYILGHFIIPVIFPKKKKLMMALVHVEDLVRAALFLAEKKEAENQTYNVVNDPPLQEQWLECLFYEVGATYTFIPAPWYIYKFCAKIIYKLWILKVNKAQRLNVRPIFDLPMLGYLTHQYYFSNQKIKDLGFKFIHNDFVKATHETIEWYKNNGWFPPMKWTLPEYIEIEPQSALQPKKPYLTPMEGGKVFRG